MKNILLIEDEELTVKLFQMAVEQAGYSIDVAMTGQEATDLLQKNKYKLVVMDMILPGINGFTILKKLSLTTNKDTPVLVLSNLGQETDMNEAIKLGAKDYLIKSNVTMEDVVEKIKKFL